MNIVLAQIRKDLIPLRGLLAAMGALLALTLFGRILEASGTVKFSGGNPLAAIQFLLIAALVVRLVHLDSLVGPDAFWRTRPISRAQLLSAKSAFLFLPILAFLAMMQPWLRIAPSTSESSLGDLFVFLAGLAAFASVTQRFSELAFLFFKAVLIAISVSIAANMLAAIPLLWRSESWLSAGVLAGLPMTAVLVVSKVLVFAGYIGVVVHQFLTLNTRRSVLAIYCLFSLAALATTLSEHLSGKSG